MSFISKWKIFHCLWYIMIEKHPLIGEIFKGYDNVAVAVGTLNPKTNFHPFQGTVNYYIYILKHNLTSIESGWTIPWQAIPPPVSVHCKHTIVVVKQHPQAQLISFPPVHALGTCTSCVYRSNLSFNPLLGHLKLLT